MTLLQTAHAARPVPAKPALVSTVERIITWVGSLQSLMLHTFAFIAFFAVAIFRVVAWDTMFLVLTTVVSLEAIYLSIFIQFSVNRQAASLKEVEQDVESIQEDVEDLEEHVEDIKEEIEEISEDAAQEAAEQRRKQQQSETLETLTRDVKSLLAQIEALKSR
jgi:peptidoglycan hydrolase CwlO-like protein